MFGAEIEAVFTLGSLAHGGFSELVSDVDAAIILRSTGPDTHALIARVQHLVVEKAGSPLSERLSLFWADWNAVRTGEGEHKRFSPIDRLDLLDSGRLLCGSDLREPSLRPSHEQLIVMSTDHMLENFTDEYLQRIRGAQALLSSGPRAVTKATLFPVRFLYTLKAGRIGLNADSARWYAADGRPGSALALKALKWRNDGIKDAELARRLLDAELLAIHAECLDEYAKRLSALGERHRASAVAERTAEVHGRTHHAS